MSTRRARIKAVTSLPPRRKNVENAEVKNKQLQVKGKSEKSLKSPRTPSKIIEKSQETEEGFLLPNIFNDLKEEQQDILIKNPRCNFSKETDAPIVDSPKKNSEKNKRTPKPLNKVSTISPSVIKPNINIFSSPKLRRNSPAQKDFTSPLAPSPKHSTKISDIRQAKISSPQSEKLTPKKQTINENNELQITDRNVRKLTHNIVSPYTSKDTEGKLIYFFY